MKQIFIDTDILINFSKGTDEFLVDLLSQQNRRLVDLVINPIVITEFMNDQSLTIDSLQQESHDFLSVFSCITITERIGYIAGELLQRQHIPFIGDALIAATCLENNMLLATRNKKHFVQIPELKLFDV